MNVMQSQSSENFTTSTRAALGIVGVSQAALARALGVSKPGITLRMNGSTRWTLEDVLFISNMLNVSMVDMLKGPGDWLQRIDPAKVRERLTRLEHHTPEYHAPAIAAAAGG